MSTYSYTGVTNFQEQSVFGSSCRILDVSIAWSAVRWPSVDHHSGRSHKPYSCSVCSKRFAHLYSLKRHWMQHVDVADVLACDACEKRFTTMYVCVRHADRPYSCQLCDKRFIQSHRLTNHMITHSGEKTFVCDVC